MESKKHFALCINNEDYEASLIPRKIYEIIPDNEAEKDDFLRIIDESGEDYLYHNSCFVVTELPEQRAKRGSREKLLAALAKAPDVEPEEYDRL